ncbi:MAG: sterol desaturase family protein [Casimicrobiaceae bacterium]
MNNRSTPMWIPVLACGFVGALLWLERKRPLRDPREPTPNRVGRNIAIGMVTAATVVALERPVVSAVARSVNRRGWGLVPRLPIPEWGKTALMVLLMDYTLYWWHVLLHRVPVLWRCHAVHHADLDLDTSTALRFHVTEFIASIPWRAAQVAVLGVSPRALSLWAKLTSAEVLFHHSNLRLPLTIERWLCRVIVTPRVHGIHHSVVDEQRNSNFSSGLALWDCLHGTTQRDVPQASITIGLPGYRDRKQVTFARMMAFPFVTEEATDRGCEEGPTTIGESKRRLQ